MTLPRAAAPPPTSATHPRTRLCGVDAIRAALDQGRPVQLLLVPRDGPPIVEPLCDIATRRGIPVWRGGEGDLRRLSPDSRRPALALALVGPPLQATLPELLRRGGACWLLHRPAYASNVGFAIRTAEVSGADGVIVDAPGFNRESRGRASHVSMGADRLLPLLWEPTEEVLAEAPRADVRAVAIESSGTRAPHEVDLTGPVLLIVGNERHGISPAVRRACHATVRIPMAGFVPSYSVQAAVSAVAYERLRQIHSPHGVYRAPGSE